MPATATPARPSLGEADRHIAARLRRRRLGLGPTRHQLAGLLGISPQQAHKYETRASLLLGRVCKAQSQRRIMPMVSMAR